MLLLVHKQKFVRRQAAVRARVAGLHPKGKAVHAGRRATSTRRTRIVVGMAAVGFAAELRVHLTFCIVAVIVVVRTGCKRSRLACHRIPAVTVRCRCKIAHVLCSRRAKRREIGYVGFYMLMPCGGKCARLVGDLSPAIARFIGCFCPCFYITGRKTRRKVSDIRLDVLVGARCKGGGFSRHITPCMAMRSRSKRTWLPCDFFPCYRTAEPTICVETGNCSTRFVTDGQSIGVIIRKLQNELQVIIARLFCKQLDAVTRTGRPALPGMSRRRFYCSSFRCPAMRSLQFRPYFRLR